MQERQHAHLVYWSQTRNTRAIVPESRLFIVMACEEKEAEGLLANGSMGHRPQMRLSPRGSHQYLSVSAVAVAHFCNCNPVYKLGKTSETNSVWLVPGDLL